MKLFKENGMKMTWFVGGFALGLTMISFGHAMNRTASTPAPQAQAQKSSNVSEIKNGKVSAPQFDQDLANLNSMESRYSESYDQQQRIRDATRKVARGDSTKTHRKSTKQ